MLLDPSRMSTHVKLLERSLSTERTRPPRVHAISSAGHSAQRRVLGSTNSSFVPSRTNVSYYGFGLVGHSTGAYVTGDAITPQNSSLGYCTTDPPRGALGLHVPFGLEAQSMVPSIRCPEGQIPTQDQTMTG